MDNLQKKVSAALIVDGHYFIRNNTKSNQRLNVVTTITNLEKKWNLQIDQRYWYTNVLNEEKYPQLGPFKKFLMAHNKGHFDVKEYPIKQKKCPICNGMQKVQSGVDVGIALRLFKLAQQYDHILLLAGDGDFTEALEELKERQNKIIYLIGFENTISLRLQPYAKYVLYLDDDTKNVNNNNNGEQITTKNYNDEEELISNFSISSSISVENSNDNHNNNKRKRNNNYQKEYHHHDKNDDVLFFVLDSTKYIQIQYTFSIKLFENITNFSLLSKMWQTEIMNKLENENKNEFKKKLSNKIIINVSNMEFVLIYAYWVLKHNINYFIILSNQNNCKYNKLKFIDYIREIEVCYFLLKSFLF